MKALCLCIALLLLSGCASTPQTRALQEQGLGSLPAIVELKSTPFYPQTDYQCGPAALATVLQSQGINITPDDLVSEVYIPARKGSLQIEMTAATRRHGMLAYPLQAELRELLSEVAAGNPVLVLQNLAFDWYPQWHYAVVIGYNASSQDIILRSGTTQRWITPLDVFERTWQRAHHWALVIVPAGKIPKTATALKYLEAAYAFEQTGKLELALRAYKTASQHWPQQAEIWMALGNLEYSNKDWQSAVKSFATATQLKPEAASYWNNYAYALHANGCEAQAQTALSCGIKIKPDDENLRDSLIELNTMAASGKQSECPLINCNK